MKTAGFLSVSQKDWLKAFWMFVLSTVVSVVGDAAMQAWTSQTYSLGAIHWREILAAIGVAVITYIQKNVLTNSKDQFLKPEPKTDA